MDLWQRIYRLSWEELGYAWIVGVDVGAAVAVAAGKLRYSYDWRHC